MRQAGRHKFQKFYISALLRKNRFYDLPKPLALKKPGRRCLKPVTIEFAVSRYTHPGCH